MNRKFTSLLLIFCAAFIPVLAQLTDQKATLETRKLYQNLTHLTGKKVLFGHQDDMAYGVGWKYQEGRSDVKDLAGEYPAVFGWDVCGLETKRKLNLDGVPFHNIRQYIKQAYDLGAINTISWHMDNPANGKSAWDTTSVSINAILPNGANHQLYKSWLDQFSVFVKTLKGSDGKAVPILFRPFHENGGGWFWWGNKSCSPEEYKALWRFTVNYLKNTKQLHNLIYVFNPCDFKNEMEYLERYPGDDVVDILSFDYYQYGGIKKGQTYIDDVARSLAIQAKIAKLKGKLSALAETGFVEIPDTTWWTNVFAKAIQENKPSYVLFWRNAGFRKQEKDNHYYAPYPGQVSADNFLMLIKTKEILLQKGLKSYSIYK